MNEDVPSSKLTMAMEYHGRSTAPRKEVSWVLGMCVVVQFSQYTELQIMHFLCCIINHALHRLFMYDPFISALLRGLISQKQMFDFEGVMTQLFVLQHILGSTFHQWDASACLVDRHRSSQKKSVAERKGSASGLWCCWSLDLFHGYFFPFYQEDGAYKSYKGFLF